MADQQLVDMTEDTAPLSTDVVYVLHDPAGLKEHRKVKLSNLLASAEQIRDVIGTALVAGTNVTVTVNDAGDTITIAASMDTEVIYDAIAAAVTAGTGITVTNSDPGNTTTVALDIEYVRDQIHGTFVETGSTDWTVNDAGDNISLDVRSQANEQTGATYTLVLADAGKTVSIDTDSTGTPNTVSIPTDASVAFPIGTVIYVESFGGGATTIAAVTPGTTTVRAPNGAASTVQFQIARLWKRAANDWNVTWMAP